ncbi:MAG TPA: hypothetical protein VJG90_04130 [Candidatus Nanoarchaeia archaeon]|nr:hypothetical protein [Candidatus Nanoarchaeia archaeon]
MNRLIKIVNEMSYEELQKIQLDLEQGILRDLIDERLAFFEDENKVCPTCHNKPSANALILQFGPADLRQQVYCCAMDCLEYFLKQLKRSKKVTKIRRSEISLD